MLPQYYSISINATVIFLPAFILSLLVDVLVSPSKKKQKADTNNPFLVGFETDKGKYYFDLIRGFAIFGASGSGKTKSGFLPIIKHCADFGLSGIIYDYKDFELSEIVYYFFKDSHIPVKTIYLTDPDFSHKVNPIHPDYIDQMADMESAIDVFVQNLAPKGKGGNDNFFVEAAAGALSGIAWRLKEDYPEKCHIPMASGILLMKDIKGIAAFIKENDYARILAAPFLDSMGSEKQMAAVKATLSAMIKKVMTPEIAMIMSGSDFSLRVNDKENPIMMTIVNNVTYESVHSPIIAIIMQTAIRLMSKRDQNPSLLLLDEGSTVKLPNLARIPATLRTFLTGTVWGLQDKVQGAITYDENTLKAILTNLSTKMFGKVNDPDTAKFYEHFFELIEKEQRSYSKSDELISKTERRINISKKETSKHRAQEFYKLKKGQFFLFDEDGESYKLQFKIPSFGTIAPEPINNYSKTELKKNFDDLLNECKTIT